MPSISMFLGSLLMLVGAIGYAYGHMVNSASFTALIPAGIGLILMILGIAALRNEGPRKHLMHGAVIVALLGFFATAGRLMMKMSELTMSGAVLSQIATALICLLFVVLAIKSFAAVRKPEGL